jgi:spore maturation protein CgeB
MKILFVDTLYSSVLNGLGYYSQPTSKENFIELNAALSDQKFGSGDNYSSELRRLGHETSVIYANSLKSQISWANENSETHFPANPLVWRNWQLVSRIPLFGQLLHRFFPLTRILLEQIEKLKPDVVYVLNINLLNRKIIEKIKSYGSVVVGQIASPLPPLRMFRGYDHIFSAHPGQVKYFQQNGFSSSWLPLAFDAAQFESLEMAGWPARNRDVTFVGTFGRHQKNTAPLLKALAQEIPTLEIFTFASKKKLRRYGLDPFLRGKAWGREMYRVLAESKIVINRHGKVAGGYSVNFRMFEATGMGALLVTERGKNIGDLFTPGREVLTYQSVDEAVRVTKEALSDSRLLSQVAKAGQQRTLKDHTFAKRSHELNKALTNLVEKTNRDSR